LRTSDDSIAQAPVVEREFSAERVLVALYGVDFVNREIEFERQAIDRLTGSPDQLELGIAEAARRNVEFGIKVIAAVGLPNPTQSVASTHPIAVSPIIQRGS